MLVDHTSYFPFFAMAGAVNWRDMPSSPSTIELSVQLGRLHLPNPIMVASGTFGYAREMAGLMDLGRLGGIVPKTITVQPRAGNVPWLER